jgi:hypothetical protein
MKWLPVILSGILVFGLREAWGTEWKYYGQTQSASYFFDMESMVPQGNIIRVWVKAVYSEDRRLDEEKRLGGKNYNLTDSLALEEIDCKGKRCRVLALTVYSMEGEGAISGSREREMGFRIPESILEGFCKSVSR